MCSFYIVTRLFFLRRAGNRNRSSNQQKDAEQALKTDMKNLIAFLYCVYPMTKMKVNWNCRCNWNWMSLASVVIESIVLVTLTDLYRNFKQTHCLWHLSVCFYTSTQHSVAGGVMFLSCLFVRPSVRASWNIVNTISWKVLDGFSPNLPVHQQCIALCGRWTRKIWGLKVKVMVE